MSNENAQFGQIGAGDDIKSGHAKYDAGKPEVFQGVFDYFPRALLEVANVSGYGAKKYSWGGAKGVKSAYERYSNALGRHIMLAGIDGPYDTGPGGSGLLHDAQVAWNALMKLEAGLKEGRYLSTRGFPLPEKKEEVKGVEANDMLRVLKPHAFDVNVVPHKSDDAEIAKTISALINSFSFGEDEFELTPLGKRTVNRLKRGSAAAAVKKAPAKRKKAARAPARKR